MKKIKMLMLLMVVVGNICLLGCGQKDDAETEIENESYGDYKNMPEISVEDNRITIVVYEDQALPYRWTYRVTDENIVFELRNETRVGDTVTFIIPGQIDGVAVELKELIKNGCRYNSKKSVKLWII